MFPLFRMSRTPTPSSRPLQALRPVAMAALLGLAASAQAHMSWILPNTSHADGKEATISVDASVSEDLFNFERALKLETLTITGPDGKPREAENRNTARHRDSFDLKLVQDGTYRISHFSQSVMASYRAGSETKRFRGSAEAFAKEVPASAEVLSMALASNRQQTFVSKEDAGQASFTPEGQGLEVLPLGPVTDLSTGDTTRLRLLFNGKPLPGATLKLLRDGNRYRYKLGELPLSSDAQGEVSIRWPEAGRYYLGVSHGNRPPAPTPAPAPGASAAAPAAPAMAGAPGAMPPGMTGGTREQPLQRASLSVTFEVLPR
ncbi:DUF4198 domain-containing protein [Ideonella sp.]|uniref:DUF4198 domain-containing protein n=1 Tax=Ideonella sp. TaxID=1929293 RepID=UPI003BB7AAFA